ncbi:tail fiber domain-containing protein [Kribbella sp. NPDC049227]|uniref:tail fiber domain-containing protein n=1 Tax=Kribbella sp. NPDC049227 TaxID=3364113 RepID=UPI003720BE8D
MGITGLVRTQYWNVSGPNPTPRSGMTSRAESRTDVEGYLLAADAARNAALYGYGVAGGLQVSATMGSTGITLAPGVAVDLDGHIVVLAEGGFAIVDPFVGPTGVQNIPTVQVASTGVTFETTDLAGDLLFTITWREVEESTTGLLVLHQAPWLRLVDSATFVDDGLQLVLAAVSLGAGGVVDGLQPGARRFVSVPASRVELRLPSLDATGSAVTQVPTAELAARTDGGADLNVLAPTGPGRRAFSVLGTGEVDLAAGLRVSGSTSLAAGLTVAAGVQLDSDLSVGANLTAGGDLAVAGNLALDGHLTAAGELRGLSATVTALTVNGAAEVTTLSASGDAQLTKLSVSDDAQLGSDLMVSHNVFVQGRVGVNKPNPQFAIDAAGTICATVFCNPSDLRVKSDVREYVGVLDRLADVRAVNFVRAGTGDETRHAGIVAQDVASSFPELVVPMGPDGLMAVDYSGLAGVLVGAVNELRAATEALSARVAGLEDGAMQDGDDDRG